MVLAGDQTAQALFLNIESHKLMLGFPSSAPLKRGQPVKLGTDGRVAPLGASDAAYLCIGHSIHNYPGVMDEVTIVMRAHMVITAISSGAVNAGPAKWAAMGTGDYVERSVYVAAADAATTQGYILTPATGANEEIEVALI